MALPKAITSIDPMLFRTCSLFNSWEDGTTRVHQGIIDPPLVLSPLVATTLPALTVPVHAPAVAEIQGEMRPTLNIPVATAIIFQQSNLAGGFDIQDKHSNPAS
jgi:hypothetical protein